MWRPTWWLKPKPVRAWIEIAPPDEQPFARRVCGTCLWQETHKIGYLCHRRAPFIHIGLDDWCGEYEMKPKERCRDEK